MRTPRQLFRAWLFCLAAGCGSDDPRPSASRVVWTGLGPTSTDIVSLAVASTTPRTLYAIDGDGRLLVRSGGQDWRAATGIGAGIQSLAVDPLAPATTYAASDTGLFKTVDGGASWTRLDLGPPGSNGRLYARVFAVDPTDSATVYAQRFYEPGSNPNYGWSSRMLKSRDAGLSWTQKSWPEIVQLHVDPRQRSTLIAGIRFGRPLSHPFVALSRDAGETWDEAALSRIPSDLNSVLAVPTSPTSVYVSSAGGIDRSLDAGATWTIATSQKVASLAVDAQDPGLLYGLFDGQVHRSRDLGETWTAVEDELALRAFVLVSDPSDSSLFAGTAEGVLHGVPR